MGNSDSKPVKKEIPVAEVAKKDIIVKCSLEEVIKNFFKDYVIIWHDPNSNSPENQDHKAQLEEFGKVLTFTEWEKASVYIQEAKEICHVITAGANGELFVKEIFEKENVHNIYVFCGNKELHSLWAKNYPKIKCVETRIETILNQIQKNLMGWLNNEDSFKLNLPAFAPIFNDRDKSQMNSLHLYLKMIPNFKNRSQAKDDFVSLSKRLYSRLGYTRDIEEFEQNYNQYSKEQILRWYTRPSFLFKAINNCLRIATSDSIQYCRLLLKDIERAIKEQYQVKSKSFSGLLYRGAYLSDKEWSSLKENTGREIEMHGFLSVSKEKNVSLSFMRFDESQKVFITIIVPKGPNEEEQGFAEIEEFSRSPGEKEILFNVRSRFTVLETEDEYSQDSPYRHLVLLYGAQGFRKFITEQNPIREISISSLENLSCCHCKEKFSDRPERCYFVPIAKSKEEAYYCKRCLDDDDAPFLCVGMAEKTFETEIRGCLLMNANQAQTPFYGYKCCNCQGEKQKVYFTCIDCSARQKSWCENCFDKISECRESGHTMISETSPFSFWRESMSPNELNHLKFQNDLVKKNSHLFEQGEMYFESHEYEKAIEYYSHHIQENEGNGKDTNLATCYNNIGLVYDKQGEYQKALEHHLKSLDIFKSVYGDNHPVVATSYHNIGSVYNKQGEYKKALEHHLKSLDIYKSVYGDNHPVVATSYNNIGLVYDKQGKYQKALEHFLKSLNILKSVYGDNHPYVATSYNNIGSVYEKQGEYQKALEYHLKSLDIKKSVYGDNHPDIATSYNNIGSVYDKQGEYQKALEHHLKSLDIYKSVYGDNHPLVATSYNNIGGVYDEQGEYKKALELHLKSLDILKSVYGDNHPDVASSFNSIGSVYYKQGEYQKALENFLKSLDIYKSVYGDNHPDVATSYNNIGGVYDEQGDYKKALELHLKSLDILKSVYGDNHPDVASSFNSIGSVYYKQGEYQKALENFLKSLNIYKSVYGDNHPDVATSYNNIGLVYDSQGEYQKALEHHLKSLDILKSFCGDSHPHARSVHNKILQIQSIDKNKQQS